MKLIKAVLCLICLNFFTGSYAAPIISNLVDPAKYFLNHEKQIIDLSNSLALYNKAELIGVSGMGKTELARTYAYKNQDKYDLIWFFDCNSDLLEQFTRLSKKINKSKLCDAYTCDLSEETEKAKKDVLNFLAPKNNWLLVFDNLHINQNKRIEDIINWAHNGHVMVCSQDAKGLPNAINLPYLSDEDASNVVNIILEGKKPELIKELVQAFKGYPILVAQGAMFLKKNNMSVAEYKKTLANSEDKMTSHIKMVLKQLPNSSKELLQKIAVINNQQFSKKLLQSIADDNTLSDDLENITRFGLITELYQKNDNQVFAMHDAVAESVLKVIGEKKAKNLVTNVIGNLNKIMPKSRRDTNIVISQDKTLKNNLEILLNNAEKYDVDVYKNMELRKNLMNAYLGLYDYYNCQKIADWLINKQHYFDSLLTSIMMSDQEKAIYSEYLALVGTYNDYAKSDFFTAIKYLNKAASLVKDNKKYEELKFNIYYHLAQVYVYGGDINNTEQVLKTLDDIISNNPTTNLHTWFTKAKMYLMKGQYEEAQKALDKYFEVTSNLPKDGIYKAPSYTMQAEILNYMGKHKEAYDIAKRTYDQQKINIKGDHEIHARVLVQLAWAELGLGRNEEALDHIKDSIRIQLDTDDTIGDGVSANSFDTDLAAANVVQGNVVSTIGGDNKKVMDSYGMARRIYYNRYGDNLFLVDDIKRFYFDAAENLCKISNDKSVLEKIIYTEYRDTIIEKWGNDPKVKDILKLEKERDCRVLPKQQASMH